MDDNNPGGPLRKADPNTIQDKFLVGYQGWFTCQGDGPPVHAGHHGWLHWVNRPILEGGRPNMDLWPDVSAYSPSELFTVPGLTLPGGQPACLFSSRHPRTVQRHFHWMAEHGVDGCFLQRFTSQIEADGNERGAKADLMRLRDEIGDRVKEAAEKEGRVFAIMYDISGAPRDQLQKILEVDWNHLIRQRAVLDSPSYLREKGRPVVAIWGVGFASNHHDPLILRQIIRNMRTMTPGGVYVIAGTPTNWQTLDGDADPNPAFLDVYYNEFDAISPWTVGRYRDQNGADGFAEHRIRSDMQAIKQNCQWHSVDYIPVVWPGGSEHHISNRQREPNFAPREGGKFLWRQIFNAKAQGARTVYGAMWDEYDEGTALMPVVSYKYNLPREARFIALDADGYDLPSDWYMRICGLAAEGLRGERQIDSTFPKKELDDYWSSRPKFVSQIVGASGSASSFGSGPALGLASGSGAEFGVNSSSASAAASSPASGPGVPVVSDSTTPDLLNADQDQDSEDAPPPYSLESSEPSKPSSAMKSSSPDLKTSQQPVPTVPLHTAPTVNLQSRPAMGSLNAQNPLQPPAPAVPSSTRPKFDSEYGPSTSEMDSKKHSSEPVPDSTSVQDSFVGGFGQGQPNTQFARPMPEASSSFVDGFHHYHPTVYSPSVQNPTTSHSTHSQVGGFLPYQPTVYDPRVQQATSSHAPTTPIPTHLPHPPLNPFPNPSSSASPHAQFPPPEWLQQDKPTYQPDQGYPLPHSQYGASSLPSPPPRHPSVASKPHASPGDTPPFDAQSPYTNYGQFSQHQLGNQNTSPHQSYFAYSQSQYSLPQNQPQSTQSTNPQTSPSPSSIPPRPASTNPAWSMVDRIAGAERRKKLEQSVDSVGAVVETGKKLLNIYKVPGRK